MAGRAGGLIISPFETPVEDAPRRPGATAVRAAVEAAGGRVFLDPTTIGAFAPGANDFERYQTWDLWGTAGPARTTPALRQHVRRCVDQAAAFELRLIGPTLVLDAPVGRPAEDALMMAELVLTADPTAGVTIAGTDTFWTAGAALDAHVGALVGMQPSLVSVAVVRGDTAYPEPRLTGDEVGGVCRSVHALSLRSEVLAAWGDLAALPAVAVGAELVGTGWDLRHRVCGMSSFRRESTMARTSMRVTHRELLATLKRPEAEGIQSRDAALSTRLVPGALPVAFNDHWRHHLTCLNELVDDVADSGARRDRYVTLADRYDVATREFGVVAALLPRMEADADDWIAPLWDGLEQHATEEGW